MICEWIIKSYITKVKYLFNLDLLLIALILVTVKFYMELKMLNQNCY